MTFKIGSSIPVLRMLDERESRRFYEEFLGFEPEWEHRFRPDQDSPLYMQLKLGAAVIHLNGHASEDTPICEVRIPVVGIQEFCESLRAKSTGDEGPEVVDPRYEGRPTDVNLVDPAGNMLTFWEPND